MIEQFLLFGSGIIFGWVIFGKDYLHMKNRSYSDGFADGYKAGRKGN